ncbi:hypothetical protein TYRP_014617 [Tyrophagus putrescentiae]|nr:hypothetical protein TYRP_014617 [Tyrophagus putrescentiae]
MAEKTAKTTSQASGGSTASQESAGIGADLNKSSANSNPNGAPNLTPEGFGLDANIKVYDAILYLIYCPEHDKVAVTNVERARCVFLPFVFLPEGVTWRQAAEEGVLSVISARDKEADKAAAAKAAPVYDMEYLNVLRLQLPSEKFITRLAALVLLKKSAESEFKCCTRSPRINWLRAADLINDCIDKVWGAEVKNFTRLIGEMGKGSGSSHEAVICEFTVQNSLHFLLHTGTPKHALLQSAGVKNEHVLELYEDFIEHCYPAFSMCFESFKHYLAKYGYEKTDPTLPFLFYAASLYGNDYLDFHELLLALVCLEPTTKNDLETRLKFVFRYYDSRRAGALKWTNSRQDLAKVEEAVKVVGMTEKTEIAEGDFIKAVQSGQFKDTEKLCRAAKPILPQISQLIKGKVTKSAGASGFLQSRRKTKGTCYHCQAPSYRYCLHCITLDTAGRAVEPRIISEQWIEPAAGETVNEHKYSMEYVFGASSMPNTVVDLEDWVVLNKYVHVLVETLKGLLQAEEKLVKVNAPVLALGDLQGSLHDLLVLEKHWWVSAPAVGTNFVFLGNFTGGAGHSVEVALYLIAQKLIAPAKFTLLRGVNEMRAPSASQKKGGGAAPQHPLLVECTTKYGQNYGRRIYEMLNEAFERLPFAAVVEESILCVHSGIPKTLKLDKLNLKKEVVHVQKEAPMAYEILVNHPLGSDEAFLKSNSAFKHVFSTKEAKAAAKPDANAPNKASDVVPIKEDFEKEVSNKSRKEKKSGIDAKPGVSGVATAKPKSTAIVAAVEVTGFADSDRHQGASSFDEAAFRAFISANGFTHLIRSGYVPGEGYDLRFDNACISVFSCSNFLQQYAAGPAAGGSEGGGAKEPPNQCTAAFIDGSNTRIRLMAFNTAGKLDAPAPPTPSTKKKAAAPSTKGAAPPPAKEGGGQPKQPPAKPKPKAAEGQPKKAAAPPPPAK